MAKKKSPRKQNKSTEHHHDDDDDDKDDKEMAIAILTYLQQASWATKTPKTLLREIQTHWGLQAVGSSSSGQVCQGKLLLVTDETKNKTGSTNAVHNNNGDDDEKKTQKKMPQAEASPMKDDSSDSATTSSGSSSSSSSSDDDSDSENGSKKKSMAPDFHTSMKFVPISGVDQWVARFYKL